MSFFTGITQSDVTIQKGSVPFPTCLCTEQILCKRESKHKKIENTMLIQIYTNIMLLGIYTIVFFEVPYKYHDNMVSFRTMALPCI